MNSVGKAASFALLLITSHNPNVLSGDSCLATSYYGTRGQHDIFMTDNDCLESSMDLISSGHIVPVEVPKQLVWLERKDADESLRGSASVVDELDSFLSHLEEQAKPWYNPEGEQTIMGTGVKPVELLGRFETSAVFSISPELVPEVEFALPAFWDALVLPDEPVNFIPVPSSAIERVRDLLSTVKFDPVAASIVSNISVAQIRRDIRYLTGEDESSPIISRHSFSRGALLAADWLKEQFESTGASCELKPFLEGFAPNVIW